MTEGPIWSTTAGAPGAGDVVLIHGSLDRSSGMLKLSRRLTDTFRVTCYDRRGYGRSMPHAGPFTIDGQVDDLAGVIANLEAPAPCVLFGHSYGGNVALAFAERCPQQVAGVAIYETPVPWMAWWPETTAGADAAGWSHDPAGAAERFMRRLVGDERWERLPAATREQRRAEGPALVGEMLGLRREQPWWVERIRVPVLVMRGEHGAEHHRVGAEHLAPLFGGEPVVIPEAKHFGPNTHPDGVAAVLAPFAVRCLTLDGGA